MEKELQEMQEIFDSIMKLQWTDYAIMRLTKYIDKAKKLIADDDTIALLNKELKALDEYLIDKEEKGKDQFIVSLRTTLQLLSSYVRQT